MWNRNNLFALLPLFLLLMLWMAPLYGQTEQVYISIETRVFECCADCAAVTGDDKRWKKRDLCTPRTQVRIAAPSYQQYEDLRERCGGHRDFKVIESLFNAYESGLDISGVNENEELVKRFYDACFNRVERLYQEGELPLPAVGRINCTEGNTIRKQQEIVIGCLPLRDGDNQ